MNQIYRALHMPPKRLIKKLSGQKEIYTIAVRRAPKGEGCDPLPALGEEPYTPLPYTPGTWYADPLLYEDDNGKRWLFCEAFNMAENRGDIAVAEFDENDHLLPPRVGLKENFHLSFPTVFDWRGEVWMLPETSADRSLTLYRCTQFPDKWEKVQAFSVGRELCDSIIVDKTPEALTVLCSETRPDNQLYTRYRRYTVREKRESAMMWMSLSWMRMNPLICSTAIMSWAAAMLARCLPTTTRPCARPRSAPRWITVCTCNSGCGAVLRKCHCAPPCRRTLPLRALTRRI